MTLFSQVWQRLDRAARFGFVLALIVLVAAVAALSVGIFKTDYQVLFGDLAPTDAATMTAELDRMKIPYKIEGNGNTIMVPAEQVYKTRLKLVGRDLPLHGTVGFELFNNADIGMTEFAQKVNYQRALQGELTRTILSYEEIQSARVHLALPEQTLFKKTNAQAKASVSLTLKPGKTLQPHEVQGIQRLVAASVPDIQESDVTVIDQHGVALTHNSVADGDGNGNGNGNGTGDLDGKEALEHYLTRKVADVLDRTFGAGQTIASVDVAFNRKAVKTTTEHVLGANDTAATGIIVHEHQTSHDAGAAPAADTIPVTPPHAAGNNVREVDYQVGRRVEQVVSSPGAIEKINVAVVVRQSLEVDQIDRIRDIVSAAAGIDKARGDGVAVYTMAQFGATQAATRSTIVAGAAETPAQPEASPASAAVPDKPQRAVPATAPTRALPYIVMAAVAALLIIFLLLRAPRNADSLGPEEREAVLARMRLWLDGKQVRHGEQA